MRVVCVCLCVCVCVVLVCVEMEMERRNVFCELSCTPPHTPYNNPDMNLMCFPTYCFVMLYRGRQRKKMFRESEGALKQWSRSIPQSLPFPSMDAVDTYLLSMLRLLANPELASSSVLQELSLAAWVCVHAVVGAMWSGRGGESNVCVSIPCGVPTRTHV